MKVVTMGRTDYAPILTVEGIPLAGDAARRIVGFSFVEGECAAEGDNLSQSRSRKFYYNNVIQPLLAQGELDDGTRTPYDDRKLRCDRTQLVPLSLGSSDLSVLEVALGISHFKAFRQDQQRTEDECKTLHEKGNVNFCDQWAYFQRNPGIAGLVLSKSGRPYVGKRTNREMQGSLNATAGHLEYRENVGDVNLLIDLFREMREEFGVLPEDVLSTNFVGAFGNPLKGDFDFTYVVKTKLPEEYFAKGGLWETRRAKREHEELVRLATSGEVRQLLAEGTLPGRETKFEVMYSTRGALLNLRDEDFRSL